MNDERSTTAGDAAREIEGALRDRLDDLAMLENIAAGNGSRTERATMDLDTEDAEAARDDAAERLDEYPLCVEVTTTFEVVLGTGGPDDRLLFECDHQPEGPERFDGAPGPRECFEIRRVLYRYSWTGSAERELRGDDRETAEALARRVVPELSE